MASTLSLKAINECGLLRSGEVKKELVKPAHLEKDKEYQVVLLSVFIGKFGRAITCELNQCSIILPSRLAKTLTDDDIAELNKKSLSLVYRGTLPTKHNPTALVEFIERSE